MGHIGFLGGLSSMQASDDHEDIGRFILVQIEKSEGSGRIGSRRKPPWFISRNKRQRLRKWMEMDLPCNKTAWRKPSTVLTRITNSSCYKITLCRHGRCWGGSFCGKCPRKMTWPPLRIRPAGPRISVSSLRSPARPVDFGQSRSKLATPHLRVAAACIL